MTIDIDGLNINYKIIGEGPSTIVILQGWGTTLEVYDSVALFLSKKYRVVQFDFPGFGKSDEPREAWAVDDYTDFFIKLMSALQISKASLIGHSYGGRVIIKLSARHYKDFEIEKIALVDSAGVLPKKTFSQKLKIKKYKLIKNIFNLGIIKALFPNTVESWKSKQGSADYRNATPIMRQCLVKAVNEDLCSIMGEVSQDTLLVWGDKDSATPISDAHIMEEKIPRAGLAEIKNAGHYCFLDQPIIFRNIMNVYFEVEQ